MGFKLNQQKLIFILMTAVGVLSLMILAGSLPQLQLSRGEPLNLLPLLRSESVPLEYRPEISGDMGDWLVYLRILFWIGLVSSIIYAFVSPEYRRRVLMVLGVVVLVLLFADRIVLNSGAEQLARGQGIREQLNSSSNIPQPPAFVMAPPHWISWAVSGVVALLLVLIGYNIWRRWRPRQPQAHKLFAQEAEKALQELEAGGEFKDVVLRCYAQMEGVMRQSQNLERQQSMTPREFERHLAKAGFSDEPISRLIHLFENVRYGDQSSDGRAEREAKECLSAIVIAYG